MLRTARNTLGLAFGLSILLHLLVLPIVHAPSEPQPDETFGPLGFETARPVPTPKPTPRPTPTPQPTRRPTPAPPHAQHLTPRPHSIKLAPQSARPHASGTPGAADGRAHEGTAPGGTGDGAQSPEQLPPASPEPQVSLEPSPAATRAPACAQPNVAATTIDPAVPETPAIAQQQGISGDVTVLVSLDEGSHVTGAHVIKSPSTLLNDAALRAALASTFRTEVHACRPIAADYAFIVEFTAQ